MEEGGVRLIGWQEDSTKILQYLWRDEVGLQPVALPLKQSKYS